MVPYLNSWKKEKQIEMGNCVFVKGSTSKWGRKHGGDVTNGTIIDYDEGRIENNLLILNPMRTKQRGKPGGNQMKTLVKKVVSQYKRKKVIGKS